MREFAQLVEVMARLRRECPWDRRQTLQDLRGYVLEEAYELAEALEGEEPASLREELGDLLLQVVFIAQIAAERGWFDLRQVIRQLVDKLVRRHPHVFGPERVRDAEEVLRRWAEAKRAEGKGSALGEVPSAMPALQQAHLVGQRAARVGFDWSSPAEVLDKVDEELGELRRAMERAEGVEEELGDLLFALSNLARKAGVDPERALRGAVRRFMERFRRVEERLRQRGLRPEQVPLEELDRLWEEAKRDGAPEPGA